jgi:hypothetical protein
MRLANGWVLRTSFLLQIRNSRILKSVLTLPA